jgi:hypothetical protein
VKKYLILFLFTVSNAINGQVILDSTVNYQHKKHKFGPLFNSDDTLHFTLKANLKVLLKDRGKSPKNHWGQISYVNETGKTKEMPVQVKVRGNFRRMVENCAFPPLLIDFDKKKKGNSVFNQQNKLKLVTHCLKKDYIMQEYLVYKIFNLITDNSFKARIAHVTYQDSTGKIPSELRLGIFLEDEADIAKRLNTQEYKKIRIRQAQLDSVQMATVSVFEYLIGNTDWSVLFGHNIKLYYVTGKLPLAVPYDFDHAGIVNTPYATPAQELEEIVSVKQRLYRGIAYSPALFEQIFEKFRRAKPDIYALYRDNKSLEKSYIKYVLGYLDDFYKTINNPRKVANDFIAQGQKNMQPGEIQIKGL